MQAVYGWVSRFRASGNLDAILGFSVVWGGCSFAEEDSRSLPRP